MDTQAELWSVAQAAKYLSISTNSLRTMLSQGDGPPSIFLGPKRGVRKFRKSDVDRWLDSRRVDGKKTKGKLRHIRESMP